MTTTQAPSNPNQGQAGPNTAPNDPNNPPFAKRSNISDAFAQAGLRPDYQSMGFYAYTVDRLSQIDRVVGRHGYALDLINSLRSTWKKIPRHPNGDIDVNSAEAMDFTGNEKWLMDTLLGDVSNAPDADEYDLDQWVIQALVTEKDDQNFNRYISQAGLTNPQAPPTATPPGRGRGASRFANAAYQKVRDWSRDAMPTRTELRAVGDLLFVTPGRELFTTWREHADLSRTERHTASLGEQYEGLVEQLSHAGYDANVLEALSDGYNNKLRGLGNNPSDDDLEQAQREFIDERSQQLAVDAIARGVLDRSDPQFDEKRNKLIAEYAGDLTDLIGNGWFEDTPDIRDELRGLGDLVQQYEAARVDLEQKRDNYQLRNKVGRAVILIVRAIVIPGGGKEAIDLARARLAADAANKPKSTERKMLGRRIFAGVALAGLAFILASRIKGGIDHGFADAFGIGYLDLPTSDHGDYDAHSAGNRSGDHGAHPGQPAGKQSTEEHLQPNADAGKNQNDQPVGNADGGDKSVDQPVGNADGGDHDDTTRPAGDGKSKEATFSEDAQTIRRGESLESQVGQTLGTDDPDKINGFIKDHGQEMEDRGIAYWDRDHKEWRLNLGHDIDAKGNGKMSQADLQWMHDSAQHDGLVGDQPSGAEGGPANAPKAPDVLPNDYPDREYSDAEIESMKIHQGDSGEEYMQRLGLNPDNWQQIAPDLKVHYPDLVYGVGIDTNNDGIADYTDYRLRMPKNKNGFPSYAFLTDLKNAA